jgi:endogenous inhibitor of DNA gyrase (YacG/DUF329 family)
MTADHKKSASKQPDLNKSNRPCPICGKPRSERYDPFCSKRCADVDLHRWLSGVYAVPVTEDEEEDEQRDDGGGTQH